MPNKGGRPTHTGKGVRSKVPLPTHPYEKWGQYWRSEKEFREWNANRAKTRKDKTGKRMGYGDSCKVRTDRHTFKRAGRWWLSEEVYKRSFKSWQVKKEADAAGLSIDEYLETKRKVREAYATSIHRGKYIKAELRRLKEKYNLPANSNRTHLEHIYVQTRDPDILAFLLLHASSTMTADEKINRIRKLFLDNDHKPLDILYQTAIICGINLRKAS